MSTTQAAAGAPVVLRRRHHLSWADGDGLPRRPCGIACWHRVELVPKVGLPLEAGVEVDGTFVHGR